MTPPRVLIIAGSDSSGGAGLEADQKVAAAHGCYALTATTALTAQNTLGVRNVHVVPAAFVGEQIDACVEDVGVDVVKTGMLASAETIDVIADKISSHNLSTLVLDPVMISTSGSELLPSSAVSHLSTRLLPLTTILTPNIPEANLVLRQNSLEEVSIRSPADLETIARRIRSLGPKWVLVKGGHVPFKEDLSVAGDDDAEKKVVVDVLAGEDGEEALWVKSAWQSSTSTHGTGCSLASAIASNLAKGLDVPAAVRSACRYVEVGIKTAPKLGAGNGPLNHFHSTYTLPFSPGYFIEYLLNRPDVKPVWDRFVNHPFVMGLGNGKLPLESFKGYIVQDYLYLIQFSRATALGAYKSTDMDSIARASQIVAHIMHETKLHINYCESFNISKAELEATEEKQACTAYTRYVLDIGQSQDWLALQVAMAPCLLGYGAVANMLHAHHLTDKSSANAYWPWIENYVAEDYTEAVRLGSEKNALLQSPHRIEELVKIFIHATKMEIGFWEMYPAA
ncbi:phosphomethylpyrimidine kinase domain-containing protein [Sarocladium implicatum]|nr:phosphomethylpyrimidine kinase domain-containing protein [Sarocladium implicatum]